MFSGSHGASEDMQVDPVPVFQRDRSANRANQNHPSYDESS